MNKKIWIGLAVIIVLLGGGFWLSKNKINKPNSHQAGKLQVTASFYPLAFFSSQIGGEKANVVNLTPAGAEPHDYEPTPQDIIQINQSKLIVLNGVGLEAWGDKVKADLNQNNIAFITATNGISLLANPDKEEAKEYPFDPHAWLNPLTAKVEVDNILKGFETADPVNKNYYDTNAVILKAKLDEIDAEYKTGLSICQQKSFVTSHAAFGYLAQNYGLTQIPISGLSPDAEPSAQELARIADFARAHQIKVIFFEALVNPKLSETIATEIGAQTMVLDPIEGLTEDEVKGGADYFSVLRQNLANLIIALQCQ